MPSFFEGFLSNYLQDLIKADTKDSFDQEAPLRLAKPLEVINVNKPQDIDALEDISFKEDQAA